MLESQKTLPWFILFALAVTQNCLGQPDKSRQTIVLFHGLSQSPASLRPLASSWRGYSTTVITPTLTGHGTDIKDLHRARADDWRRDFDSSLSEALSVTTEGSGITLVGYSTGGAILLDGLRRHFDQLQSLPIDRVVLIAPLIDFANIVGTSLAPVLKYILPTWGNGRSTSEHYGQHSVWAIAEARKLVASNGLFLKQHRITIPISVAATTTDDRVSYDGIRLLKETQAVPEQRSFIFGALERVSHRDIIAKILSERLPRRENYVQWLRRQIIPLKPCEKILIES